MKEHKKGAARPLAQHRRQPPSKEDSVILAQTTPQRTGEMRYPERRGVSCRSVIEEAKAKVTTTELASRLSGQGVQRGREAYFRCPLHDDRTPSLRVEPERDVWFCDPCLRGGDVIELARLVWGYEKHEVAMAAAQLLTEFGHQIPARPPAWFARQERQKPARDVLQEAKIRHIQRRIFRTFIAMIADVEDEDERRQEVEFLWTAAEEIAVLIWAGRRVA